MLLDATTVAIAIAKNPDGGTLHTDGQPLPTSGYFVAIPLGSISLWSHPTLSLTTIDQIDRLLELIDLSHPQGPRYIGWWSRQSPGSKTVYEVEPVLHIQTQPDALTIARALNQTHIFSITTQSSIPTTPETIHEPIS